MNRPNGFARVALISLSLLIGAACQANEASQICEFLGVCDPPRPQPETVLILCDASGNSTCSRETLDSVVALAVQHLGNSPESELEVWTLSVSVGATEKIFQFTVTASERSGLRAVESHQAHQIEDAKYGVSRRATAYFETTPSSSPIIESLGKLSLSRSKTPDIWHIIIISDGLEYSHGTDWECFPPGDVPQLIESIQESGILTPESFQDATFNFAFVTLEPIEGNRCPVEIGAARKIRKLWEALLTSAGAHSVTFDAGPPDLEALHASIDSIEGGAER